jgi:hypothetical protein
VEDLEAEVDHDIHLLLARVGLDRQAN